MALNVLIVDDNQDNADVLALLIKVLGHTATVAYDGAAGLRAAAEQAPDCLILDINMPKIDGYALAPLIRQQAGLDRAKLLAVSANSGHEHIRRVEEAGFDYWLTKPFDPVELQRLLTMIDHITRLAEQTELLAQRNVALAERTEAIAQQNVSLANDTKQLLHDVKQDMQAIKEDVREIKEEIREVKARGDEGEGWKDEPKG